MNRRQMLTIAGTIAIAGCISDETSDNPSGEGHQSPSMTAGDEIESNPEPIINSTVQSVDATTRETASGRTEAAVTGTIKNTGDARLSLVSVSAKFYNGDGELLTSSPWDIRDLEPGEVWEPWIAYGGEVGNVERGELVITDTISYTRTVNPDGAVVASSDIEIPVDDYAMPNVVAEVENRSDQRSDYLEARPKVYAKNGHLLETGIDSIQGFPAGEQWRTETQVHFQNESWKDRIGDHDVVLVQ